MDHCSRVRTRFANDVGRTQARGACGGIRTTHLDRPVIIDRVHLFRPRRIRTDLPTAASQPRPDSSF